MIKADNSKTTKIGITGGSGYIGHSLANYLRTKFKVKILDIAQPRGLEDIEYVYCDVRKRQSVEKGLKDVDLVIHTAIVQIPLINEQKRMGYEVNYNGTQNVCEAVEANPRIKGLVLASSWHSIGERGLKGVVDEEFGFRPDKVEDRARLYALSKVAQECIVRFFDEMSSKTYAIIRMGTVLGEGMPEKTAANIFIENALRGKPITPFRHSMYRPMFYVDLEDAMKTYSIVAEKIVGNELKKPSVKESGNSIEHVINVYYPKPITILELAEIIRDSIAKHSSGKILPTVEVVETNKNAVYAEKEKTTATANVDKVLNLLNLKRLKHPRASIDQLVRNRIAKHSGHVLA